MVIQGHINKETGEIVFAFDALKHRMTELGEFAVSIATPDSIYTDAQRKQYWKWVDIVSEATGYTTTEVDTRFRLEYGHGELMPAKRKLDGSIVVYRLSLSNLSKKKMSDFMTSIYHGELDNGIQLDAPVSKESV